MATSSPNPNSTLSAVTPASDTASPPPSIISSPPPSVSTPPPASSPPNQPNANPPDPTTPSTPASDTAPPSPSISSPPPSSSTPPPGSSPPNQPNANPPDPTTPSTPSPPPESPTADRLSPPTTTPALPTQPPLTSPPPVTSSPPSSPNADPPSTSVSPPPPPPTLQASPPVSLPRPPPPSNSSTSPPPPSNPPTSSPPPASSTLRPNSSPPPPSSAPPRQSLPPPPSSRPSPQSLPPPPSSRPPLQSSPPPSPLPVSPPSVNDPASSAPESLNSTRNGGFGIGAMVAIGVAIGIIMLSFIGLAVWCMRKQRKEVSGLNGGYVMPFRSESSLNSDSTFTKTESTAAPLIGSGSSSDYVCTSSEPGGLGNSRSWFTYEELVKATNGFSSQNLLGEGGFGSVYKGCLLDGREVAVKQLKIGGGQGEREFKAEVEIISRIHHRHLVSLVGYCICENKRLLVYDYVPNNTLHFHLHGKDRPVLDWATRVKIAAGAARGIAYLHEDCYPRIIHRDIKSSNILLDNNFEAKVSDFGLAKLALNANTHLTTRVMGTFGYMAPEYATSGKLTEKSDVFSYGVVLLELITGRKPVDVSRPLGDEGLVEWARHLLSHALENEEFEGLADPRLEKNYIESEMLQMIEAAAACVRHSAAKRPRMGQIVRAFDSLATADLTNGMRVGESEIFNSAEQSAEIRLFRRMAWGNQDYSTEFFSQESVCRNPSLEFTAVGLGID